MAVPTAIVVMKKVAQNGVLAERGHCHRCYELFCKRRHDNFHRSTLFYQKTSEHCRLISSNASRYAKQYVFAL